MAARTDRLAALWAPHPSLQDAFLRQRARVGAGLLLAMLPLCFLAMLLPASGGGSPWPPSGRWLQGGLAVALLASYALVRRGRVTAGLLLALLAVEASVLCSRWALPGPEGQATLVFLALPVLLAGVLLPPLAAALAAVATLVAAWLVETALGGRDGSGVGQDELALGVLLACVALISVLASAMAQGQARRLDESARLLRQVAETIPEVFFVFAADLGRAEYVSPAYEAVWGRPSAAVLADPLDWLAGVHPEDRERVARSVRRREEAPLEFRVVHPSGVVRHVRSRTFPVRDAAGRVVRFVGFTEDVTAALLAQRAVAEAQAQRTRLMQQLAHDLASPLSPVKIQLRLLEGQVAEPGRRGLAVVKRNVEHVERLVEDLKDVVRLEGGELRLDRRPLDLAELCRQAAETLAPAAAERGVAMACPPAPPLPVVGDAGRLTQVLYNLASNALKFTPPGGTVQVEAAAAGGEAVVAVRDTGAGMRPDQLERLFRPFSQVHDAGAVRRPEDKGTGLGLYISKGIVEAHGGSIRAGSAGPGQGSTFTFRLPLAGPA